LFVGQNNSTEVITLKADGAATFAGNLLCADSKIRAVTSSGHGLLRILNSSSVDTIGLDGTTGAATFAGSVNLAVLRVVASGTTYPRIIGTPDGTFYSESSSGVYPWQLLPSGAASFAGTAMSLKLNGYGFAMANPSNTSHTSGGLYQTNSGQSFLFLQNGFNTSSTVTLDGAAGTGVFSGTVSAQGSVLTSDQRFKENITDAKSQLADVTALGNKLRNWDWTADAPVADKATRFLGLVAQEAETICPGIVTTIARTKDGAELTPEVVVPAVYETKTVPAVLDKEGKVVEAETTEQVLVTAEQVTPATYEKLDDSYKGIKNDILIMKLLGAVAELSAEVAALKAG